MKRKMEENGIEDDISDDDGDSQDEDMDITD